mgnify:CR=1 FL=1
MTDASAVTLVTVSEAPAQSSPLTELEPDSQTSPVYEPQPAAVLSSPNASAEHDAASKQAPCCFPWCRCASARRALFVQLFVRSCNKRSRNKVPRVTILFWFMKTISTTRESRPSSSNLPSLLFASGRSRFRHAGRVSACWFRHDHQASAPCNCLR